jgi:putative ATPase
VYILKPLGKDELIDLVNKAVQEDEYLKKRNIKIEQFDALLTISGGDARKLLNLLDIVVEAAPGEELAITDEMVKEIAQQNIVLYDKSGENHYDIISAFIKSMRGSDPNAALYWLARMIEGGEDPKFIARRMLILASEDIGNANPNALLMANACFQAVNVIGYPESSIILSQTAVFLATSPKSNSTYLAIWAAQEHVRKNGALPVPLPLRNAPTKLMQEIGYGDTYKYAHDFAHNFVAQEFMPDQIKGTVFYEPGNNPRENDTRKILHNMWGDKYKY